MPYTDIKFVRTSSIAELEAMIPPLLKQGYQPYGVVQIRNSPNSQGGYDFFQAMVMGDSSVLAANQKLMTDGDAITVQNSAGAAVSGTHKIAIVNGALVLKLDATVAPLINGQVQNSVPVTNNALLSIGTTNRKVTSTVAAGALTNLTIV
ncbi:hypothetical protein [Pantoea sp. GM01]|uniref:hypothetical protein n=1 Tax=Pantoea sp. GM01 TaxID=1144320 RepID=UPI000271076F|nr:hypothetical protein [Pantoea sp. GM01]EJL90265.1 hypothetical protein PMI17_01785 [Pantoea sp. GM01]